ncbi:MAG: rhomboid family intramembrane serine protease [Sedimentisphaerales bacterium]|nr:rhomboid family intramembrane serine protease [Sedimentisphaerales bacterium]
MIPIRISISPRRTPYTNYVLIAINIAVFVLSYHPVKVWIGAHSVIEPLREWAVNFELTPEHPQIWQFVTYAFLHGGFWHIFFNMYFLYLFGNSVNDKLGHTGYLCFYLAGAVFSGIGHVLLSSSPVLGASGAVAAVTGAYLVLFPKTLVTIAYWFIFIGTMELPAIYFIGLKMIIIDNVISQSSTYVAYNAHLSGYAFGIIATMLLLATGLIPQHYSDLLAMIKQANRRRKYRDTVSKGDYDPFKGALHRKTVNVNDTKSDTQKAMDQEILDLRSEATRMINQRNLAEAARLYMELTKIDRSQILPEKYQLDIANQLMAMNQWGCSADAYEKFLNNYKNYEYIEQVQLMLGILYSRYLRRKDEAVKYLMAAHEKLTDPGQIKMCEDELSKLE